ncbi:heterokaryon incompatibility protein [Colletotrichum falcatum]|nr:heterokaryon incompatibility protein [Colletotrichum falcatum]
MQSKSRPRSLALAATGSTINQLQPAARHYASAGNLSEASLLNVLLGYGGCATRPPNINERGPLGSNNTASSTWFPHIITYGKVTAASGPRDPTAVTLLLARTFVLLQHQTPGVFSYAEAMHEQDFIGKTAVPLATKWLEECGANHPSCGKAARHSSVFCTDNTLLISDLEGKGLVATRLLFFPLRPASEEADVARLQLSESLGPDTRYAALSHRWGARETCCTTRGNLRDMTETGMRVSELPATFRDAVRVARGVGLSHVWIDSLCIVQDDKEDWKREARRMAIIYDNATITIAANDGLDSSSGLGTARGPDPEGANVLDSRAWVCQERMISPRSLIFTGGSVVWECRECDASVASPELKPRRAMGAGETPTHPKDIFVYFRDWRLPLKREEPARVAEVESDDGEGSHDSMESRQSVIEGTEEMQKGEEGATADTRTRRRSNECQTAPDEEGGTENGEEDTEEDDDSIVAYQGTSHWKFTPDGMVYQNSTPEPDPDAALATVADLHPGPEDATGRPEDLASTRSDEEQGSPERPGSEYDSDGYPAYRGGLPGHAANLAVFLQGGKASKPYRLYPEDLREGDPDPFSDFVVVVSDLDHPQSHYWPFLKTWWSFISNYSPLCLTYGSDKFLAINGITAVAQRWTHLRSSFGLFYHFLEGDLMWYVDPDGPPGARHDSWLVPTWSWASTRNGRVRNDVYARDPLRGNLMIKPVITAAMGTAFDQPLPFAAWMARRYHSLEVKGDLRKGVVTAVQGADGRTRYPIVLDSVGRFSDEEVHDFRPDCAEDFPIGRPVNVFYMVWYHYDAEYFGLAEYIDIGLVLRQMKGETEIGMYEEEVSGWEHARF